MWNPDRIFVVNGHLGFQIFMQMIPMYTSLTGAEVKVLMIAKMKMF